MLNDLYDVDFVKTGSEIIALLLESEEIKKHKPQYNRMRKAEIFTHAIDWFKDSNGIVNFKLVPFDEANSPIISFTTYASARERLVGWIDDYHLCLRYCGLTSGEAICFNHQLKKCFGVCNGQENVQDYNKRAIEIVEANTYQRQNFILMDRGRNNEEESLILIDKGNYKGFGYLDNTMAYSSPNDLKELIKPVNYYPDSDLLIKGWLKKNKIKKIVLDWETALC